MTNKNFYEKAEKLTQFENALKNIIYEKLALRSIKTATEKQLKQLDLEGSLQNIRIQPEDKKLIKTLELNNVNKEKCNAAAINSSFMDFEITSKQLILLKKVKGGKTALSSGVLGFIPNNQIKCFATKIQKSLFYSKKKKNKLSNYTFLFMTTKEKEEKKKFHIFKAPLKRETLKMYPYTPKNKIKNKLNSFKNQMNFVFFLQKIQKTFRNLKQAR
jgi:hypothetical protein